MKALRLLCFVLTFAASALMAGTVWAEDSMSNPWNMYSPSIMRAAGNTIRRFTLNLSLILQSCVFVEAIVVSDINDKLSPKNEPPMTSAAMYGISIPVFSASPMATGVKATIVPTLVPMDREMKHAATKIPASNKLSGRMCKVRLTVASMAPICLALSANAPARMNIHIICKMSLCAAPLEKCCIRSSNGIFGVMAMA